MFTRIKKSIWFKLLLIFIPIFIAICVVLGIIIVLLIAIADGFGSISKEFDIELQNPFSQIAIKENTTITLDRLDDEKSHIYVIYETDANLADEVYFYTNSSMYKINYLEVDGIKQTTDSGSYVINATGKHDIKLELIYEIKIDKYRRYEGVFVINNIPSSTLKLSDNFKIKNAEDLVKQDEKINIVTKTSSLKYYTPSERIPFYQFYTVFFYFTIVYTVGGITFAIIVFVKSHKEKKAIEKIE